jgi:hypothetical protein
MFVKDILLAFCRKRILVIEEAADQRSPKIEGL